MNTSIIIPIHEHNDEVSTLLNKALESINKQEGIDETPETIIVAPKSVLDNLIPELSSKKECAGIKYVENTGDTNYQSQVNLAVDSVTKEYFSVLEFDDEYSSTYFKNVEKYIKAYSDVDIFLTMMIETNEKNQGIKLTNETVWAQQFVGENGEIGHLNQNALKQYTDFKLSGGIIKTSEFNNLGKYKTNIKLSFMYEFILRALNNASKIFSIPKIGYKHLATRPTSMFDTYMKEMSVEERKFWFETANKESNFMNDRPIDTSRLTKTVVE